MLAAAVAPARQNSPVRYNDYGAQAWLRAEAPCRWHKNTEVEFRYVALRCLQSSFSGKHPEVVFRYECWLRDGKPIAPLVVSEAGSGTYYIHDGNHRCEAMRSVLKDSATLVRVAVVVPGPGFFFRWRWFSTYGTYVLEPERRRYCRHVGKPLASDARFSPLLGKTLVLVAHPDDETGGCAALLQHVCEPIVVYATDGAPADEFFWRRWGSRDAYGRVRRSEAERALAAIGVRAVHFLEDHALAPARFADQQLHQALPAAVLAVLTLVEQHRPDAILVPAYEGGHPDHDACSFIGFVVGRLMSLPIWEMPLYHRSTDGELICQSFRARNGTEIELKLSVSELTSRGRLISHYSSQADLGRFITSDVEYFRPQPRYDYSKPPHEGMVNYEVWEWPVSAVDLCRSFRQCATTWDFEGFVHDAPPMPAASHPPYRLSRPIQAYGI